MSSFASENDENSQSISSEQESSIVINKKSKKTRGNCVICGAKAVGINFNVATCTSCKAFFRRNGLRQMDSVKCRYFGSCRVDEDSRRQCTACRIQKCFAMGMARERIRTVEQNQYYRDLVAENRKERSKDGPPQPKRIPKIRKRIQRRDIDDLYDLFILTANENIPKEFIFKLDSDPTKTVSLYCAPTSCLITFIKQIPSFQSLPVDDRLILLKNNTKILLPMLAGLLHLTLDIPFIVDHHGYYNLNDKIVNTCLLFSEWSGDDSKLLLLTTTVLFFCPSLLTNKSLATAGCISNQSYRSVINAYDKYAQMLWDFIIQKSFDNTEQAVLICMKLVTTITHLQQLTSEIYDIIDGSIQVDKLHMMLQSILHLA